MKKILALLLAVAMIAAFCACAQQSADTAPAASTDTATETTTDTTAETPAAETTTDTAAETPAASDGALIKVGIIAFALSTVFQLVTLPVEINASRRALAAIGQTHMLDEDEYGMAKKTLTAAAMTYVAALAVSLAQLLRLLLIFGGRNRDDR